MPRDSTRLLRARYEVLVPGEDASPFPDVGAQRVTRLAPGRFEVEVGAGRSSVFAGDETDLAPCLAPSTLIDIDDPQVVRFTERALRGASSDPRERASILRRAVSRHVRTRDFGTAFARASEVVRNREGDCSEHAVFPAAALASTGCPPDRDRPRHCRLADGRARLRLAHVDPVCRWTVIDLDPTRPLDFDAGHLLVSTRALSNGRGEDELVRLLPLLGRIGVRAIELDGRTTGAPTP